MPFEKSIRRSASIYYTIPLNRIEPAKVFMMCEYHGLHMESLCVCGIVYTPPLIAYLSLSHTRFSFDLLLVNVFPG